MLRVFGPCSQTPVYSLEFNAQKYETVSDVTLEFFKRNKVIFSGDDRSIQTLLGLPGPEQNIEIMGNAHFRYYGVCYSVNGQTAEVYPNEYYLKSGDLIDWYICSIESKNGIWEENYLASHLVKPDFLCKK